MTKQELIHLLEPFDNEIEVRIVDRDHCYEVMSGNYGMLRDGTGVVIVIKGELVSMPRMVA